MIIDKLRAEAILRHEAAVPELAGGTDPVEQEWQGLVKALSDSCEGSAKTHIAFLGTAILAKATDLSVDVLSVKAKSPIPGQAPPAGAYSARVLAEKVLVPVSVELGIDLGVSGRQPLNNQPYFRMIRIGDNTPIHGNARATFGILCQILDRLAAVATEEEARKALRAYVRIRRQAQRNYAAMVAGVSLTIDDLLAMVEAFVALDSEGGKRAQAVVAGLLDVYAGSGRVDAGKINDPSRHYPGDVVVYSDSDEDNPDIIEKAFEVRDKPVSVSDVQIFGQKALGYGVRDAAVVAVSPTQELLDHQRIGAWANERMMGMTIFYGWRQLIPQVMFWVPMYGPLAAAEAVSAIHRRLLEVEVSEAGANWWVAHAGGLAKG